MSNDFDGLTNTTASLGNLQLFSFSFEFTTVNTYKKPRYDSSTTLIVDNFTVERRDKLFSFVPTKKWSLPKEGLK